VVSEEMQADEAELSPGGYADEIEPEDVEPQPMAAHTRRRLLIGLGVLGVLVLLAVLPPLINVNRYQRRIAASIGASLGRPVHMDSVSLNVLPVPGFTLTNFVVSEDPGFGGEPVIRADSVRATLRMRSLWHRRVEFSKIALEAPSVNLVRRADGRWNIESILLQASRVAVNPTEQKTAGDAPRFPYIEATGARVNFKSGLEKKPLSLTEAEFALWLPEPEMWRLRLEAHPTRTDTAATDTGTLRVDGTLGKASRLEDVPIDLHAEWSTVPLGAASWVLMGRDGNLRGEMTLRASAKGTVGDNTATARLQVLRLRRAEFVPDRMLDVDVSCKAGTQAVFHRLTELQCLWPPDGEQSGLGDLVATGEVPDIHHLEQARVEVKWDGVRMSNLLDGLREVSQRVSPELLAGGTVSGVWICCGEEGRWLGSYGEFGLSHTRLSLNGEGLHLGDADTLGELAGDKVTMEPFALDLGGAQPAELTVDADRTGVRMRLTGMVLRSKLMALGKALPQFGDGLEKAMPEALSKGPEAPVKVDLVGTRVWGGGQVWTAAVKVVQGKKRLRRR
jgi:hypothetical protein